MILNPPDVFYSNRHFKQEFACKAMGELCRSIVKLQLCPLQLLDVKNILLFLYVSLVLALQPFYKLTSFFYINLCCFTKIENCYSQSFAMFHFIVKFGLQFQLPIIRSSVTLQLLQLAYTYTSCSVSKPSDSVLITFCR